MLACFLDCMVIKHKSWYNVKNFVLFAENTKKVNQDFACRSRPTFTRKIKGLAYTKKLATIQTSKNICRKNGMTGIELATI